MARLELYLVGIRLGLSRVEWTGGDFEVPNLRPESSSEYTKERALSSGQEGVSQCAEAPLNAVPPRRQVHFEQSLDQVPSGESRSAVKGDVKLRVRSDSVGSSRSPMRHSAITCALPTCLRAWIGRQLCLLRRHAGGRWCHDF